MISKMMRNELFIGIDSSCYTTSFAVCDCSGNIICDHRQLLPVKDNTLGLRQSDAVFLHIKNYTDFFRTNNISEIGEIKGICVSSTPRSVEGSYMPVFCVSDLLADIICSSTSASVIRTSHQKGHLYSALIDNDTKSDRFLAVHLSGGTSEILEVIKHDKDYDLEIRGHSLDISAGQLIDRVGVRYGFRFPAGSAVEVAARNAREKFSRFKISVKDGDFSLSGVEAQALRSADAGVNKYDVLRGTENAIARTLENSIYNICCKSKLTEVICFGGVICNEYIKEHMKLYFDKVGISINFADKKYSSDNACGLARHAYELMGGKIE